MDERHTHQENRVSSNWGNSASGSTKARVEHARIYRSLDADIYFFTATVFPGPTSLKNLSVGPRNLCGRKSVESPLVAGTE